MCTLHDFSVLKSNLFIRALLLDRILVTGKTTRTPRVHLVNSHDENCYPVNKFNKFATTSGNFEEINHFRHATL